MVEITTTLVVEITTTLVVEITTHSYIVTLSYMVKDAHTCARAYPHSQPNAHRIVALQPARYSNPIPERIGANNVSTDNPPLSQAKPALLRQRACIGFAAERIRATDPLVLTTWLVAPTAQA